MATAISSSSSLHCRHNSSTRTSRRNPSPPPSFLRHHRHLPRGITLSLSSSSSSSSPFTDFNSDERHERERWLYKDNEVSLRLPDLKKLLQLLKEKRRNGDESSGPHGSVCLVGTGPGDPELLTLKAAKAIENADLLLYDRLVSHDVLQLARDDARLLYVGKTAGYHSRTQEEIHQLLLGFAEAGANVVRLKGGDPLVLTIFPFSFIIHLSTLCLKSAAIFQGDTFGPFSIQS